MFPRSANGCGCDDVCHTYVYPKMYRGVRFRTPLFLFFIFNISDLCFWHRFRRDGGVVSVNNNKTLLSTKNGQV